MASISVSLADLFQKTFGEAPAGFDPQFNKVYKLHYGDTAGAPYYAYDGGREMYMPVTLGGILLPFPTVSISLSKTIIETPLTDRRGTVKELISIRDYEIHIRGMIVGLTNDYPEADVAKMRNLFERNEAVSLRNVKTDIFLINSARSQPNQSNPVNALSAPQAGLVAGPQAPIPYVQFSPNQAQNQLDMVVIKDMEFPELTGVQNVQPYEIKLVTDNPFTLIYNG